MFKTISDYDFVYRGRMDNSMKSLPLGNGDLGANVWADFQGSVHLLISKTDAWSERYRLLKVAHLTLALDPCPFDETTLFNLSLEKGVLSICANGTEILLFMDANAPCLRARITGREAFSVKLDFQNYRRTPLKPNQDFSDYYMLHSECEIVESPDHLLATANGGFAQVHHNEQSCYEFSLKNQNLESYLGRERDPLLNWTFGAAAYSDQMVPTDAGLKTPADITSLTFCIYSDADFADNAEKFTASLDALKARFGSDFSAALPAHEAVWKNYWNEAYIYTDGFEQADTVNIAFQYQRYMLRCADRGKKPIKFNGTIFTADQMENLPENYDARSWGAAYWIQNTRLIYWNLLMLGEYEGLLPFFDMCLQAMPISIERTKEYFGHQGMLLPETFSFFGLYCNTNFGYSGKTADAPRFCDGNLALRKSEPGNRYIRYHFEGMLEVAWMMLCYLNLSGDRSNSAAMFEFCKNVLLFFDRHFDKIDGHLLMYPVSSLETWQICVNDAPDIAGLTAICNALKDMDDVPEELALLAKQLSASLPDLPVSLKNGVRLLAPFETNIDQCARNTENPELYSIFPFPLYGLGKPDLELARRTYFSRTNRHSGGWSQDPLHAVLLGLKEETAEHLLRQSAMKDERALFPAFWGPNFDETPDQCHGSVTNMCLILMLLQTRDQGYDAFPCWPENWNVRFKLPLNGRETVYGQQIDGKRTVEIKSE